MKFKRTPDTHVLVVMISPEERNKKPYALPVQCVAYHSLKDEAVRSLVNSMIKEMTSRGMKVAGKYTACVRYMYTLLLYNAGFVTDGEWNSLRSKGRERPLSIFEIRAQVRRKYTRLSVKTIYDRYVNAQR